MVVLVERRKSSELVERKTAEQQGERKGSYQEQSVNLCCGRTEQVWEAVDFAAFGQNRFGKL